MKAFQQGSCFLLIAPYWLTKCLVLKNNISPRRLALGDNEQERSPVSGAGVNITFPAQAVESSCLAPNCDRRRYAGFSADIIETILFHNTSLADQSLVLINNMSPRQLTLGDTEQERYPVLGAGDNIPSPAQAMESSCLAPEGDRRRDAGFLANVIKTILNARAPSTRIM